MYLTDHSYHLPARLHGLLLSFIWQLNSSEDVSLFLAAPRVHLSFALFIVSLSQAAQFKGKLFSLSSQAADIAW